MFESLLAGFGILFIYKLTHDFMLDKILEDAKKPIPKPESHVTEL